MNSRKGEPPIREQVEGSKEIWTFPVSFAQRRLWFLDQIEPGAALYNVVAAYRIRGRLDRELLERAFSLVVERHEVLRTTFGIADGEPVQVVTRARPFRLPVVDLSPLPAETREAELERRIREEARRPFDLAAGPLMRALLIEAGPHDQALVLCLHHTITDAWSQNILLRELTSAYSAFSQGVEPMLSELPIQYADFAAWQREAMSGDSLDKELGYWRERLRGVAPLDLPTIQAPGRNAAPAATHMFEIPEPLTTSLRAMAQREGVTLFMVMLAGWKAYLSRLTGQADIAVGSPISERGHTETEDLIGFFLNTLLLRTNLDGDPTVSDLLKRVRDTTLESFSHQALPYEIIVEELQPARVAGRDSLLRAMFVLVTGEEKPWRTPEAEFVPMPVEETQAKFDLMLHIRDLGRTIRVGLVYNSMLFDEMGIRRMGGQYRALLAGMTASPETRLSRLPLIDPHERLRKIEQWNDTAARYPADQPVHELFRAQVRRDAAAIAIQDGAREVSYGELDTQSDAIAGVLHGKGIGPGQAVAISLPRSAGLVAGILGILKTGAAYVPIDPSYPQPRQELILRESGARLVIAAEASADARVPALAIADCLASKSPPPPPAGTTHPDSFAYVMFTSGSTGVPKGVKVLHRGIARLVINTNYVHFGPDDVIAHASNTSFDASTFELWGALLNGGRLVIVPRETLLSPRAFERFLHEREITVLFLTTPLFHQLAREIPGAFGALRYLVAGGDVLKPDAARAVLETAPPAHLVNGYGPTEVTTFAICHEVTEPPPDAIAIPIGRPISNTRAYILDASLEPVAPGIAGELCLGGPGVAGGYINNAEATAASFITDPFSTEPAGRLYKTGDLARWRDDGVIEFVGRADQQLKIRGFRVEPAEIEAVLLKHPAVREAVVTPRRDGTGQKQLVAYVSAIAAARPATAELREHILASLPEYMAPAAYAFVDALPLTANGKVDLDALAALPLAESGIGKEIPGTWLESAMVEIWEDLLGRSPIGVTEDFFDLGGHSLLAIRMLAAVENRTGIKISPTLLFETATIRHLAAAARRPEPQARSPILPLQQGGALTPLFFMHGDFVEGGLYCIKMARFIGAERPFYSVDPHGLYDEPPYSIEKMASDRIHLIRQACPRGPYVLGGFCNGGLVAFEMARQLQAAGETVSSLVLLSVDGSNVDFSWLAWLISLLPGHGAPERVFQAFLLWRERIRFVPPFLRFQFAALAKPAPLAEQPRRIARKAVRIGRKVARLFLGRTEPMPAAAVADPEAQAGDRNLRIINVYNKACEAYVPRSYSGRTHLLWPAEIPMPPRQAGWSRILGDLNVVKVPGGHFSSLQADNLRILSEKIRECLLADRA